MQLRGTYYCLEEAASEAAAVLVDDAHSIHRPRTNEEKPYEHIERLRRIVKYAEA